MIADQPCREIIENVINLTISVSDLIPWPSRTICEEVCDAQRKQDREEQRARVAIMVTDDLIFDVVGSETQTIASNEMRYSVS